MNPGEAGRHCATRPTAFPAGRLPVGICPITLVVTVHELSRLDARRIAVRAQLLDRPRPTELLDVMRHLTLLQIDPTAAIAACADLVAWSRLGASYSPAELDTALADRTLLELRAVIRPSQDLARYRADMAAWARINQRRPAGPPGQLTSHSKVAKKL
jgi:uncharacterized protein YcaQ